MTIESPQIEKKDEEEIDNGFGILVKKKTIYHGSGISGIKNFNKAEEDTVGSGVYFTSEEKDAIGYARRRSRSRKSATPTIYESLIENVKLLDLRNNENVKKILDGFKPILVEKSKDRNLEWHQEAILQKVVESINSGNVGVGNLRDVTFSTGRMFSDYCKSLGYEGLVTLEGREGEDVGNHDTYLIFDAEKVKINNEKKCPLES